MEDQQPPTDRLDVTNPGYTPDQPLKNFVDNVGIQVALRLKVRDDYCKDIAKSFTDLDWGPDVDGINRLRQELEKPWRKAILVDWQLNHETLKKLRTALNNSTSNLVSGIMTELTDDLLEDINPEEEHACKPRKRELMDGARINSIRDDSQEQVNWLRLRNCIDITGIRVPEQSDLRTQVKTTQLGSLLRLSLLAAKKHSQLFLAIDDSPTTMGTNTHLEAFETAKDRAGELLTQLEDALREDMVELVCDQPEKLEGIHETLIHAFITSVLAFATVEARWAVFHHPTTMGRAHGHTVMELIEELRQDDRLLNTQLRAAGALIATLQPSNQWGLLQDLKELAYMVAAEVPALGSHVGAETLHRQIRSSEYKGQATGNITSPDQEDEDLEVSAPRTTTRNTTYFAHPPAYTKVNGKREAPLAGPLDKHQPLKELTEIINRNWSTRPVREAIVTINAATLLVETLRTLPDLRKKSKGKKKRGNTDKNIPAIHQRFLQQSTLVNADDYLFASADEVAHIRENHWKQEVMEKVEEIRTNKRGKDLDSFVKWLESYNPAGYSKEERCKCGREFTAGKDPTIGVLTHLNTQHNTAGINAGKVGSAHSNRQGPEPRKSVSVHNPFYQPTKKKARPDHGGRQSAHEAQAAQGRKRTHSHTGPKTAYNRRPDHEDRGRRHNRADRDDHSWQSRDDRRDRPARNDRRDRDDRSDHGDRSERDGSDSPHPRN